MKTSSTVVLTHSIPKPASCPVFLFSCSIHCPPCCPGLSTGYCPWLIYCLGPTGHPPSPGGCSCLSLPESVCPLQPHCHCRRASCHCFALWLLPQLPNWPLWLYRASVRVTSLTEDFWSCAPLAVTSQRPIILCAWVKCDLIYHGTWLWTSLLIILWHSFYKNVVGILAFPLYPQNIDQKKEKYQSFSGEIYHVISM